MCEREYVWIYTLFTVQTLETQRKNNQNKRTFSLKKETYIFYNLRHENMIDAWILETVTLVKVCVTVCDWGLLLLLHLAELEKQDFNWRDKVPMLDPPLGCFFFP